MLDPTRQRELRAKLRELKLLVRESEADEAEQLAPLIAELEQQLTDPELTLKYEHRRLLNQLLQTDLHRGLKMMFTQLPITDRWGYLDELNSLKLKSGQCGLITRAAYRVLFEEDPPASAHLELVSWAIDYELERLGAETVGIDEATRITWAELCFEQNYRAATELDREAFTADKRELLEELIRCADTYGLYEDEEDEPELEPEPEPQSEPELEPEPEPQPEPELTGEETA